jgi:hypothetical protein
MSGLLDRLQDVPAATSRYGVRDDRGRTTDTLKVIGHPDGGYLGVYHTSSGDGSFAVDLATSADLLTWRYRVTLDAPASQPAIAADGSGGFVLAVEAGGSGRPAWLRFAHYRSADRLLAGVPDRVADAPHTLVPPGRWAEGTPSLDRIDGPVIDAGFHYQRRGRVDRQARGRLTGFRDWAARAAPELDAAVEAYGVRGNIGGRSRFVWAGREYLLIEGQQRRRAWDSWRTFLYDPAAGTARPLAVRTHGGSRSIANPAVATVTGPSGDPVLVVSLFLFDSGAAPGEAGPLLYYR